MTKIAVQTTKYETTRQKGVHSMSQSENANHADLALRSARVNRGALGFVIDEMEEGVGELSTKLIHEEEGSDGVMVISGVLLAIATDVRRETGGD